MSSIVSMPRRLAALLLLAAGSGGALASMASASGGAKLASCEIALSRSAGALTLTALAHADRNVAGRYSLRVSGSGTDIRQGGSFEVAPDRPATLGTVTLGSSGAHYRADLDLHLGTETLSCSRRIGGAI